MSPTLFALYINDLIAELNTSNICYAFADDLVIVAEGEFQLDQVIGITERWSERNGIEVNKAKSGIIQVRKDRRTPNPILRSFRGYPLVDQYKYLGVMIDNSLSLRMELQNKKQIERQLIVQKRRMAYMRLDQSARYHVW